MFGWPLMKVTKQHLSFFASAHATSPNAFFSELRPLIQDIRCNPHPATKDTQREHHKRGRGADLENNVSMVWLSSNGQHWLTEDYLFLATCDIASPVSVSQLMYLGFLTFG